MPVTTLAGVRLDLVLEGEGIGVAALAQALQPDGVHLNVLVGGWVHLGCAGSVPLITCRELSCMPGQPPCLC